MTSASEPGKLRFVGPWLLLLVFVLTPRPSAAQPEPGDDQQKLDAHTRTAARSLAAQGAEAFERGDFEEALDLFERAGSLIKAPTIALMEARTLAALGRLVEAANKYSIAQLMDDPQQHNEAYQDAITAAGQELAALKPRIPLVKIQLIGDLAEGDVEVWLDGRQLPEALVGVDNPLDPGRHRVEVRPRIGPPRTQEFEIAEGQHDTQRVGSKTPARAPSPPPAAADAAPPDPIAMDEPAAGPRARGGDAMPWIVLGAGAASTVVGIGTGIVALGKKSDLDDAGCNAGCPPEFKSDITAFRRYRTISYVGFGLGAIGLGWGGYLLLSDQPEGPRLGFWVTPNSARLNGRF